ncbi:hypothetical protein KP509_18G055500 [Ceratopteris richardii]|nr:hypothetical protein KP509_18G055500 [Ceratopteris richardii]
MVMATIELGEERSVLSAPSGPLLSERLVELKRLCMARFADYFLQDNAAADAAALDDPLLEDNLEEASEEEEDSPSDEINPSKKRK